MSVNVRRIKKIASEIDCRRDGAQGFFVIGGAVAVSKLISANGPGPESDFGNGEARRSQLSVFQWSGVAAGGAAAAAAATGGFAGGGALWAPIPTERCFGPATSAQGPMGFPAAFTGTRGLPCASLSQVILKSS